MTRVIRVGDTAYRASQLEKAWTAVQAALGPFSSVEILRVDEGFVAVLRMPKGRCDYTFEPHRSPFAALCGAIEATDGVYTIQGVTVEDES